MYGRAVTCLDAGRSESTATAPNNTKARTKTLWRRTNERTAFIYPLLAKLAVAVVAQMVSWVMATV
jgi:hypothetical protein